MFSVGEYKTKGGKVVDIVAVVDSVAIGYFDKDPTFADAWDAKTGSYISDLESERWHDLIDPNAKPIKQDRWVPIYRNKFNGRVYVGALRRSKRAAQNSKCKHCIAIAKVTIDCMEGDGLD